VDTGRRISILVKVNNHCRDSNDQKRKAWIDQDAVKHLDITAEGGVRLEEMQRLEPDALPKVDRDGKTWLELEAVGADVQLARYSAILHSSEETIVEISAKLRDRSIQIVGESDENDQSSKCAQEEGTAWGSTAIMVRTTTSRTTTSTSTTVTTTSSTKTETQTTSSTKTETQTTSSTKTETQTSTSSTTGTSTSSTWTTSTSSTITTTTRPCACFEMCCESKPVQGVHLPVVPNVCPEWWQGKMTGRAWQANASGLPSNLEESLKMKRSRSSAASGATDGIIEARSPSEHIFFQKWSSENIGLVSASSRPWVAIGMSLAACAVALQMAAILNRRRGWPSAQLASSDGDVGVMDQLVHREESIDGYF